MAQLKDLLVSGQSRLVNDVYIQKLQAPTTAGGSTFGLGTDGQILKSNGSSTYWGDFPVIDVGHGGTGVAWTSTSKTAPAANTVFAGDSDSTHTAANNNLAAPSFRTLTIDDIKGLTIGYCDSADTDTTKVIKLNITEVNKNDQFIFYLANTNSTSNSSSTNLSLTINNNINCDTVYDENIANRFKANATLPKGYYAIKIVQKTGVWTLKPIPIDYKSVPANTVFAGPNNSNGAPSFRTLDATDLPVVPVTKGGTGVSTNVDANTVFAGPTSGSGTPEFRKITKNDIDLDINIDALYNNFIQISASDIYFNQLYITPQQFILTTSSKVLITLNGQPSNALYNAGGSSQFNTGFMTAPLLANNPGMYTLLCMCQNYLYQFILYIYSSNDGSFRFKFYPYYQPVNGTNVIQPSSGASLSTAGVGSVIIYY